MRKGYSVIEILVVIGVFAILGVIATQSINLSLKSSKKGDSITLIKQELDYVVSNIGRNLQMANTVYCPNTATRSVGFRDNRGNRGDYGCVDMAAPFYVVNNDKRVASSSGEVEFYNQRLTSQAIDITSCSFTCTLDNLQTYIDFSITASAKGVVSAEGASVTTSRKILVRGVTRK